MGMEKGSGEFWKADAAKNVLGGEEEEDDCFSFSLVGLDDVESVSFFDDFFTDFVEDEEEDGGFPFEGVAVAVFSEAVLAGRDGHFF
jgi:hypothetical protein